MDPSVKPGEDFYRYANGSWLARSVIPCGQQSYDTRAMLADKTSQQVRDIIQNAATTRSAKGSIAQKVGDYYASLMDEAGIEAMGLTPLAGEMDAIAAISNKASLSAYLGNTLNSEIDGLTANADHVLGVWINQGFEDSDHNFPHLWQGGLGLPDPDNYVDPSPKGVELRVKYQAHIAAVLKIAGFADSEARAVRLLSFETRMARTFAPDSDAANVFKQNNLWKRADFDVRAPGRHISNRPDWPGSRISLSGSPLQ
jgi:predicted metalloendopeptidase